MSKMRRPATQVTAFRGDDSATDDGSRSGDSASDAISRGVPDSTATEAKSMATVVMGIAASISSAIDLVCRVILVVAVLGSCGITFASVLARVITGTSLYWSDDATEIGMAVTAFMGCVSAFHHRHHVGLQVLSGRFVKGRWRREIDAATTALIGVFGVVVGWSAAKLATANDLGTLGSPPWPTTLLYIPLALGCWLLVVMCLLRLVRDAHDGVPWVGLGVIAVLVVAGVEFEPSAQSLMSHAPLAVMAITIVVTMVLGMPIAFALGVGTLFGVIASPGESVTSIPLQMTGMVTNLTLIAVPFFILAGVLLGQGDIAVRIMSLIRRLSRNARGSQGVATVLAMYLFSGLSGSKFADIAAVAPGLSGDGSAGVSERGEMAGLFAASAVMGETVPPSITMLVLGAVTTLSTGALFVAGLLPAALLGGVVIVIALIRRERLPHSDLSMSHSLLRAAVGAFPAIGGVVIIAGGIMGGFTTPSEASSIAVMYSIVAVGVLYRVSMRQLIAAVDVAARLAGMLLFLISVTGALAWLLTISGIAADVLKLVSLAGGSRIGFMLISVAILIVLGSVFEGLPAIIIFAPLLLPQATSLGINGLQYGIVLLMAMGVGTFLPPLGVGYYATCAILDASPERSFGTVIRYMVPVVAGVVVVALIPVVSTGLVTLLHVQ